MDRVKAFLENLDTYRDKAILFCISAWWPKKITPNHLSWSRVVIAFVIGWMLVSSGGSDKSLLIWLFIIGAVTDMVDGSLARGTNQVTEFGAMLDPTADRLLVIPVAVYALWHISQPLLWTLAGAEALNLLSSLHYKSKEIYMESNIYGKTKMVFQAVALAGILIYWPNNPGMVFTALLWVSVLLTVASIGQRWTDLTKKQAAKHA